MGRFRSLLRRSAKPVAFAAVAMVMSLSLIVTTPSNAHALTAKQPVKPSWVLGAVKTVAPAALAAASFTPVGWGLRLFQLGMLAYDTSDIWMPYVTGLFGTAKDSENYDPNATSQGQPKADPRIQLGTPDISSSYAMVQVNDAGFSTGFTNFSVAMRYECKWDQAGFANTVFNTYANSAANLPTPFQSFTVKGNCAATKSGVNLTGHPVGAEFGLIGTGNFVPFNSGTTMKLTGPGNHVSVGTFGGLGAFDPRGADVSYLGKSECIDAMGNISWVTGPQIPGDNGAMLMPSCAAAGKGHGTGRTQVIAFKPDGTQETVWDTGANPLSDPATPLCDPGRATSGCTLEVTKNGQPCTVGDVECENWTEDAKNDQTGTKYGCKFGPYTLPLNSCNLLEGAYAPGGSLINDENTDGDPATKSNLGPSGEPATSTAPAVTGTGTDFAPSTPGVGGNPGPSAEPETKQCFPTGWAAFNPIEWVLKPIRCAFEPTTTDVQTRVQTLRDTAKTKAPISWIMTDATGPGGSGCPSWRIFVGSESWSAVCDSSFTAAIVGSRGLIFTMLSVAMVWPLLRSLWYAAIPILRVQPSSGGK